MKKIYLMLLLAGLVACNKENPDGGGDEQALTCEISIPEDGTTIDLAEIQALTIKGDAEVNTGEIAAVELKIGDNVIADVTEVPFEYTYTFPEDQQTGELTISLTVTGDEKASASDEVKITLIRSEEEQTAACEITAPEDGAAIDLASTSAMTVKGGAEVNNGGVANVELKIGDNVIADVTEVPFEYTYTFPEDQQTGELTISLTVTGDKGALASDEIAVTLTRTETTDPADGTFTDARDGHVYKIVTIGEQTWMAENLAWLPKVNKPEAAGLRDGLQYYFVLNYDGEDVATAKSTAEYAKYGVLYNWYAAMGADNAEGIPEDQNPSSVQGPCPEGWHIPAKAEWQELVDFVASELEPVQGNGWYNEIDYVWVYEEGLKNVWSALAGLEGWAESSMSSENPDLENGPRDSYGFNAVPSGMCWQTGAFGQNKTDVSFWMPHMQSYGGAAITFTNNGYLPDFSKSGLSQYRGYSVRCVKD